jgi:exodeoxyribonuclease III
MMKSRGVAGGSAMLWTGRMRVASWNINSLRHRAAGLRRFVRKYEPDVICLQEIKVPDLLFPHHVFDSLGYRHVVFRGQKGYHGVAIASRRPIAESSSRAIGQSRDARHILARIEGIEIHNVYVPAGGPDPDPVRNPKFAAKLAFLRAMATWMSRWPDREAPRLLVGDFNVAPLATDVWSHERMRRTVTHTEIEVAHLARVQRASRWVDVARSFVDPGERLFTWWSYRAPNWRTVDKGRRLDHIWASPSLAGNVSTFQVATEVRGWKNPSDHAPLLCDLR